jgi:hypothetical protein
MLSPRLPGRVRTPPSNLGKNFVRDFEGWNVGLITAHRPEEARRATAEAERAKADAKTAQESEEATKQRLADAEAARVAAEGRERTCENANKDAIKPEPSFGERLRSLFGFGKTDDKSH